MSGEQTVLPLSRGFPESATRMADIDSIISLSQNLIRHRSEPYVNKQNVLDELSSWFDTRSLSYKILKASSRKKKNQGLGLISECGKGDFGSKTICITACLDTAPIGESLKDWDFDPLSASISNDGRLHGRGSADSKVSISIYSHLFDYFKRIENQISGKLIFLADTDEHNGRFGAIKELIKLYPNIDFVYIGYPGNSSIRIGSRGFLRLRVYVHGTSEHSGSRNLNPDNAIERAFVLGSMLSSSILPKEVDADFSFGPKLTVTQIQGGSGFTNVPDRCRINVDIRLTPNVRANAAFDCVKDVITKFDSRYPSSRATSVRREKSWPAYKIDKGSPYIGLLKKNAEMYFGSKVPLMVTGPSNVGNFLAERGIKATSGFGVSYGNLHAANEWVETSSIVPVYNSYRDTLESLLT